MKRVPVRTIRAAKESDTDAIKSIIRHFRPYIIFRCLTHRAQIYRGLGGDVCRWHTSIARPSRQARLGQTPTSTRRVYTGALLAATFPLCNMPRVRDAQFCGQIPLKNVQIHSKMILYKEMEDHLL